MTSRDDPVSGLSRPFVEQLPVTGAAVSTIGGLGDPHTMSASDSVATRMDEAQLDVGEGPCWDTIETPGWIDAPDIAGSAEFRWPGFRDAIRDEPISAVFAYPLRIGGLQIGTLDLYRQDRGELPADAKLDAQRLADQVAPAVLRATFARLGLDPESESDDRAPRAIIHQATGMVLAQLDVTPEDALLLLRGRAFATGRPVRDVARDVIDRRLDFSAELDPNERRP
jgi:hypothetical protein